MGGVGGFGMTRLECADWMIESSMTNDELAKLLDTQIWVIEAIRTRNILPSHKIQKTLCDLLGKTVTRRRTYEK